VAVIVTEVPGVAGEIVTVKGGDVCPPAGILTIAGIVVIAASLLLRATAMPPGPAIGCDVTTPVKLPGEPATGVSTSRDNSSER
jgi:hypothetical protein